MSYEDEYESEYHDEEPAMPQVALDIDFQLAARAIANDHTPEGSLCLATYLGDRVIGRQVGSEQGLKRLQQVLDGPVKLAFHAATDKAGDIQGTLYAVVPAERLMGAAADDEPWKTSDDADAWKDGAQAGDGEDAPAWGLVFLSRVIRIRAKRVCGDDLSLEAFDMLKKIASGEVKEIVDQVIESL